MKKPILVLIKPDGLQKRIAGHILTRFLEENLTILAVKTVQVGRSLAEAHYRHLRIEAFYEQVIQYLLGKYHGRHPAMAMVFYGEDIIKICRRIAGATNPEEAEPKSIRGSFGRITKAGVYENVIHVSSDQKEAEREIKLWFSPDEIITDIFSTKTQTQTRRIWA